MKGFEPGDKVVCIWAGPWYDLNLRVPSEMKFPREFGVYTVRFLRFFESENRWGLYLHEIVNLPIRVVGIREPVEMPFAPSYFIPLEKYASITNSEKTEKICV